MSAARLRRATSENVYHNVNIEERINASEAKFDFMTGDKTFGILAEMNPFRWNGERNGAEIIKALEEFQIVNADNRHGRKPMIVERNGGEKTTFSSAHDAVCGVTLSAVLEISLTDVEDKLTQMQFLGQDLHHFLEAQCGLEPSSEQSVAPAAAEDAPATAQLAHSDGHSDVPLRAVIDGHSTEDGHTYFRVNVSLRGKSWSVKRRYSDFEELRESLENEGLRFENFPRKHLTRSNTESVIAERTEGFNAFLSMVLRVQNFAALSSFLEVPAEVAAAADDSQSDESTRLRNESTGSPQAPPPRDYLTAPRRQIFLIRHAHKMDQVFGWDKFWDSATHKMDTPLSPAGQSMAADVGVCFKDMVDHGLKVDNVFVSPYLRCMQTAYPLANSVNCQMKIESGLKEMPTAHIAGHPEWEDCGLLGAKEKAHLFPLLVDTDYEPLYTDDVDEVTAELYFNRMLSFARSYLAHHTENETNVFVSHNLNLAVFISLLCGCGLMPAMKMAGMMKVASVTRLYEQEDGTWAVDRSLGGSLAHMSAENFAVADGQDHDEGHQFYKKVKAWAFSPKERSVKTCADEWSTDGPLSARMEEAAQSSMLQAQSALEDDIRRVTGEVGAGGEDAEEPCTSPPHPFRHTHS